MNNKINHRNYYNQEFGTFANFKEIDITDVPLFEKFKSYNNLSFNERLINKSYAKRNEYIEVKTGGVPPQIKVGDVKIEEMDIEEFLAEHNSDIDFLVKYKEVLKDKNFYNRPDIEEFFPNIPENIIRKHVEIEWKAISIEKIDSEIHLEYKDEDSWDLIDVEYDVYKIIWENKTIPHSIYYHFDEGLVRVSNHWGVVGKNNWYLRGEVHYGVFRAGFISWDDIESYTEEEYYNNLNNKEEEEEE